MPTVIGSSGSPAKKTTSTVINNPVSYGGGAVHIAIVNQSTVLTDAQVRAVIPALQTQVTRDFYPVWGVNAVLGFYSRTATVPANAWIVYVRDDADVAGALGYHDDLITGLPVTYVFARTAMTYGYSWTVTMSHEILEMLADPWIIMTMFQQYTDTTGRLWAYEVCDACEADQYGYKIGNVLVSDFIFPAWFHAEYTSLTHRFDFMRYITAPLTILPGGYALYFDVGSSTSHGWNSIEADRVNSRPMPRAEMRKKRSS
jgi:hypothetical protein